MRKKLLLFFWIAGILFPMAWLGRFSPAYRRVFDSIFSPEWMHWIMHALLFGGLAILVLAFARRALSWKTILVTITAVLAVGVFQEAFQLASQGAFSLSGSLFDLGVDLAGGALALAAFVLWTRRKSYRLRAGRAPGPGG